MQHRSDVEAADALKQTYEQIRAEIGKVIIGQDEVIKFVLISIFSNGHCLLVGVPGLAKTLLVQTVSQVLDLDFNRIQFTPDLMPSDIIGSEILGEDRNFKFIPGPVFSNIILADEINRTPPKTQAALLEAMQEYKVTYAGTNYDLPKPFLIIATQNPIEQAGTYPLPEAQLDRFLLYIKLGYPSETEELQVLKSTTGIGKQTLQTIMTDQDIITLQQLTRQVHISEELIVKINQLVRSTRPANSDSAFVKQWCEWGAGPRAGQALVLCAKARAVLNERFAVLPEDINTLAFPILRHRVSLNFRADAEGITTDDVIAELLKNLK